MDLTTILEYLNTDLLTVVVAALMIGLDILILGIGVVYILFGMLFGTRTSLRRALAFIIPYVLFLFILDILTKIIMNVDICCSPFLIIFMIILEWMKMMNVI